MAALKRELLRKKEKTQMLKPATIMGWHADVFESKQISYPDAHLRVFVHSRCVVYLLRDDCVSFRKKNDSFCCCINFVSYH